MAATNTSLMLTGEHMLTISYADVAMCSLSLIGAGSIIIGVVYKKKICQPEIHPIFHMSLADFLASLCLMVGSLMYVVHRDTDVNPYCRYVTGFASCFYVITFLLTMTYAIEVYLRLRERVRSKPSETPADGNKNHILTKVGKKIANCKFLYPLYVASWSVPIGVTLLVLLVTRRDENEWITILPVENDCTSCLPLFHYNEDICLSENPNTRAFQIAAKYLFLIPLLLVMTVNCIIYILVVRSFKQILMTRGVLSYQQHKDEKKVKVKTVRYQVVFFICWMPSLILGIFSLTPSFNMNTFYWLYIVQAFTAPLQGFFNSIVYGWNRSGFKRALGDSIVQNRSSGYSSMSL